MRTIAFLFMLLVPILAFAKVEDKPLITPELTVEGWINAWTQSEPAPELQHKRASLLRVIHHFLTGGEGHWMILMREQPNSGLSEAVSDLVRMNSGIMHEITLDQFLGELALHGDLTYVRGHNLSESGVALPAIKEAFRLYLRSLKNQLATTVLKVNMEDLRLSSRPNPEYRLIFEHMITMLRQENIHNFRLIVSSTPAAWNYVFSTYELQVPILLLEDHDRLQVLDGGKLEVVQSCESLVEQIH